MSKSTEGIVYAGRAILEALRSGLEVSTRANTRTSPLRGVATTMLCRLRRRLRS